MNHDYLLSICMMVKDEEKNIRRCLDAMKPLIEKSSVELIVVDTGSSDETAAIAREYTDKVYFHMWNNHFSDMRNISISYARGEFVFIMDADEVLQDPQLVYDIVLENRQYANTLTCKIKNLNAYGGFTIIQQERIFRNDGSFRYDGAVHNQPRYKAPVVNSRIYIEHYGYMFNDKELREKKFQRTGGILKAELKREPNNAYYRYQLAKIYSAHGDMGESLEEIRKAYRLISDRHDLKKEAVFIYGAYTLISLQNNEFEEAIQICNEGIELQPEFLDFHYILAVSLEKTGRSREALDAYMEYIDLASRYDSLTISVNPHAEIFFMSHSYQDNAISFIVKELCSQQNYNDAYKFAEQINDRKNRIASLVRILLRSNRFDELSDLIKDSADNGSDPDDPITLIESEMVNMNEEQRKRIAELFSSGSSIYAILSRSRLGIVDYNSNEAANALRETDFNALPAFYAELFLDIDKNTRPIISIIKKLGKVKAKQYIANMVDKRAELKEFFEEYLCGENIRNDDHNSLRVFISAAYVLLFNEASVIKNTNIDVSNKYAAIFRKYVENGIHYVNVLYNSSRMRLLYKTLDDPEDRFFISLQYAKEAVDAGDVRSGIRFFTEAVKTNPYLACFMKYYRKELIPGISVGDGEEKSNGQY